ncbi:MAG: hypothetical protein PHP65_05400 [Bacilli bacterium]|nr:hypothetical protein [Bacilli bacterium]
MKKRWVSIVLLIFVGLLVGCSNPTPEEEKKPQQFFLVLDNYRYYLDVELIITAGERMEDPLNYVYTIRRTNKNIIFKYSTITFIGGGKVEKVALDEEGYATFTSPYPTYIAEINSIAQYTRYLEMGNPNKKVDLTLENYQKYFLFSSHEEKLSTMLYKKKYIYEWSGTYVNVIYRDVTIRYLNKYNQEHVLALSAGGSGELAFIDYELDITTSIIAVQGSIYNF